MKESFTIALKALRDPVKSRQRQALVRLEEEWRRDEIVRFAAFLAEQETPVCVDLCAILAQATAEPLIEVLGAWARRDEAFLRKSAMQALQGVPGALRARCLARLLTAPDEAVRKTACDLLGASGVAVPGTELIQALQDPAPRVVLAAIGALERLAVRDAAPALALLAREAGTDDLKARALQGLVALAPPADFPEDLAVGLLESGSSVALRNTAAWALGQRPAPRGRGALLATLAGNDHPGVRAAAAQALARFHDPEVTRALLAQCAAATNLDVALGCQQALKGMDHQYFFAHCAGLLAHPDLAVRLETIFLLADLAFDDLPPLLLGRLAEERHPVARAALAEALGVIADPGSAWDALVPLLDEAPAVAYAALSALGEMLDDRHLPAFIALFERLPDDTLREAALCRLALYARAAAVPASLRELLVALFHSANSNVAWLAVEVAGRLRIKEVAADLLDVMDVYDSDNYRWALARAALQLYAGDLAGLVQACAPRYLRQLEVVIQCAGDLGRQSEPLLRNLADHARARQPGSQECLARAAQLDPAALVAAMDQQPPETLAVLLDAWQGLPPDLRAQHRLPWDLWLRSPDLNARRVALAALDAAAGWPYLNHLIDMALNDAHADIRRMARQATRRVVGA